jgi:hypothetical protein
LLAEDRRTAVDTVAGIEVDRCRYQHSFERGPVACPAFQSLPFVAATSYGKPLGTHITCAHLQVGESRRNQFYPRCALGGERGRMRWVATIGPGEVEVMRTLQADFEGVASDYRPRLVAAKARLVAEPPPGTGSSREALSSLVRAFIAEIDAFVGAQSSRIAQIGMDPATLNISAARSLLSWQSTRRVDLPGIDESWFARPVPDGDPQAERVVDAGGLLIGTSADPVMVRLAGQVDQANLKALAVALEAASVMGAPVIVDVSGLTFCSVAGMRQLSKAAADGLIQMMGIPAHMARGLSASALAVGGAGS